MDEQSYIILRMSRNRRHNLLQVADKSFEFADPETQEGAEMDEVVDSKGSSEEVSMEVSITTDDVTSASRYGARDDTSSIAFALSQDIALT